MNNVILIEGLSKKFYRSPTDRPRTFQELFSRGLGASLKKDEFWALRNINFELAPGRVAGIIGRNGSGKSTLLRLVGGVGKADQGRITTQGRIGALIDLGAGFHPDLTGRENVYINGVISGLTRQEVMTKFDSIVDFSELENFIDSPLRIYSLGMQMRLAFSVAIHIQPAILLIDEVLSVGDIAFQSKCLERIAQFKTQGCAILLVSHDTGLVSWLCDEVLWLDEGEVVARGEAQEVVDDYLDEMEAETRRRTPESSSIQSTPMGVDLKMNENRFGSQEMEIEVVNLCNSNGETIRVLDSGDMLNVEIDYFAPDLVLAPIFEVMIYRADELMCWDGNTQDQLLSLEKLRGRGRVTLTLDRLDLGPGQYYVDVGIYQRDWAYAYDYHWHVYELHIGSDKNQEGVILPPHKWSIERK